jgi:hypothetical protein
MTQQISSFPHPGSRVYLLISSYPRTIIRFAHEASTTYVPLRGLRGYAIPQLSSTPMA